MEQPLKNLSWADKIKNDKEWFRRWADYLTSNSRLASGSTTRSGRDYGLLYGIYNNQFPEEWFTNITNPYKSSNKNFRNFPAKIRPINYLRTNIDLLLGEFLQRPIKFQMTTSGSFNRYMDGLNNQVTGALQQFFNQLISEQGEGAPPPPDIKGIEETYKLSWRDKQAIRAQRKLKEIVKQYHIKRELVKCKKDFLVAGEAYTFKGILPNGKFMYHRVSPSAIDYDKSNLSSMVNKGQWVSVRYELTPSEITDMFWDQLEDKDYVTIDAKVSTHSTTREVFHSWLSEQYSSTKVEAWHIQWRARRKILVISGFDEDGLPYEFETDETYKKTPEESQTHYWKDEIYEVWKVAGSLYIGARNLPYQENLSYNGRVYSDTHSNPISVMEMGIPIQIMLMIVHYKLELTIVQSKGKIVLMDKNTIPRTEGWTEEKFFYYSEAKGWALVDRSQQKVDKTWNQYQVLDLTLYERISQLIEIAEYLKQSWDDLLGISRPRKGATAASDAVGVMQQGLMQSNIITDMIFYTFEELIEDDLNGLAELSRQADAMGIPAESWMINDFDRELAAIDPLEASLEKQNVFLEYNTEELSRLNMAKQYASEMLQNGQNLSTVLEVLSADNMAELKGKVLAIEDQMMAQGQQAQEQEQEFQERMEELQRERAEFEHILNLEFMNAEYDRKEGIEDIKGTYNTFTFQDGDANDNNIPDATEIMKLNQKREAEQNKRDMKMKELEARKHELEESMKDKEAERKSKERIADKKAKVDMVKARAAARRPKSK